MPALPPAANVVKVRMIGQNQGSPWNNLVHLQYAGAAPSAGGLNSVASQVVSAWQANIAPICSIAVTLTRVECVDLTSNTSAEGAFDTNVPGTLVAPFMPASAAMVLSWNAQVRYRGGHPRMYIPAGVLADLINGKLWTQAFLINARAAVSAFLVALNAVASGPTTFFVILLSYRTGNAARPVPLKFPVTAATVHPRLDSQRRRLGKEIPG